MKSSYLRLCRVKDWCQVLHIKAITVPICSFYHFNCNILIKQGIFFLCRIDKSGIIQKSRSCVKILTRYFFIAIHDLVNQWVVSRLRISVFFLKNVDATRPTCPQKHGTSLNSFFFDLIQITKIYSDLKAYRVIDLILALF